MEVRIFEMERFFVLLKKKKKKKKEFLSLIWLLCPFSNNYLNKWMLSSCLQGLLDVQDKYQREMSYWWGWECTLTKRWNLPLRAKIQRFITRVEATLIFSRKSTTWPGMPSVIWHGMTTNTNKIVTKTVIMQQHLWWLFKYLFDRLLNAGTGQMYGKSCEM